MKTKNKPAVYPDAAKQSKRDIVEVLICACPGDSHGQHPCDQCNYCAARKAIVDCRDRIKLAEAQDE